MIRPATIEDALAAHRAGGAYAGGMTVHMLERASDRGLAPLIDLSTLPGLVGIASTPGGLSIGALTVLETLRCDPRVRAGWPALAHLLGAVGSLALRHQATLGGNIAWGHGDLIVPLMVLGAHVVTPEGRHPVGEQPAGALILSVEVPLPAGGFAVEKVGHRAAFSPTLVTVAAGASGGRTRLAAGGGPTPPGRLRAAEALAARARATSGRIERGAWSEAVRHDRAWASDALADGDHRADVAARVLFEILAAGALGHG